MTHDLIFPALVAPPRFEFPRGTVSLVGAGPGDPGLLTLHAVDALRQAEVVLYDALVSNDILRYVDSAATLEFVGKRGGQPSPAQGEISARLILRARDGHRVVRLKGGDPFVFGRGCEEAVALSAAGIPFRVIPGITAGIGGLAYAGIPVTSRDTNHGVVFVTGTSASQGMAPVDWRALANTDLPLVIYMGMSNLAEVRAGLIAGGRRAETPVAIVSNATTKAQRVVTTTLRDAEQHALVHECVSPAIIVVGEIVRLRSVLMQTLACVTHE